MKLFERLFTDTTRPWRRLMSGILLFSLLASVAPLRAVDIAPATAADIIAALGPDANGLAIQQEDLPDLFTLTSSRIDESATKFFVEQQYHEGRWNGGKALIEYARDLSYTLVSIYDKSGKRQRLYSVKTRYAEHLARKKSHARQEPDLQEIPAEQEQVASRDSGRDVDSPSKIFNADSSGTFEWDEAKGDYVYKGSAKPVAESAPAPEETTVAVEPQQPAAEAEPSKPSRKRRKLRRGSEPAQVEVATRDTGSSKSSSSRSAKGAVVAAAGATWVERKEVTSAPPSESSSRKSSSSRSKEAAPVVASAPKDEVVAVRNIDEMPDKPAKSKREPLPKGTVEVANIPERRESGSASASRDSSSTRETPGILHEEQVPSTEDLLADEAPVAKSSTRRDTDTRSSRSESPTKPLTSESDAWSPKAVKTPVVAVEEEVPAPRKSSRRDSESRTSRDELPVKPITSESDAWVPKAVKTPTVVEPVIPETKKVASLPRKSADEELERLLKASEASGTPTNKEADAWVPKNTAASLKGETDLNKEIQRVRAEERMKSMPIKKAPIKRDVNNPEEGVLPVSSFEKFSGSMYGRHREYERRFYPGKLKKGNVPVHDFYVDEVDRKKEFHNVYFYQYQKGKPPKLVAVERHDKVSFRSNYDIDKEDKGKLSTYN